MAAEPKNDANPFDVQTVRLLAALMSRHDLSEIDLSEGDRRLRLLRGGQPLAAPKVADSLRESAPLAERAAHSPAPIADKPPKALIEIKSELVGTFYSRPNPDAEPYVRLGGRVQPTTVVGLIEAMKLYNDVTANCTGVVAEILVENQQAVEFGQVLFRVDPTA